MVWDEEREVEKVIDNLNVELGGDLESTSEPEADGAGMGPESNEGAGSYQDTLDGDSGQGVPGN